MLDLIEPELSARGIDFVELTRRHRATAPRRSTRFQSGEVPLFLISLKAGGVGLNLTAADTVIHYDPWWNPAVEDQATDRAHRIGQDKPVFVYKLIARGHGRGAHARAAGAQAGAGRGRARPRPAASSPPSPRPTSKPCSSHCIERTDHLTSLSFPKEKVQILLLEGIHENAIADLTADGYTNLTRLPGALDEDELAARIGGVHLLGIRSRTQVTPPCWTHADKPDGRRLFLHRHQPGGSRGRAAGAASRCSTRRSPTPAASPSWCSPRSSC